MSNRKTVLFICSSNVARSIMAEAILNQLGADQFAACSAGSMPIGRVNPLALEELRSRGYSTDGLLSKSWDNYTGPQAPDFDFVITVCGKVAEETPPVWSGDPCRAVWKFRAPGSHEGTDEEIRAAFSNTCDAIEASIRKFLEIPFSQLNREEILERLRDAG